jgi:hypothetical protein
MRSTIEIEIEHVFGPGKVIVASEVELGMADDPDVRERNQHIFADMAVATNLLVDEIFVQRAGRAMAAKVDGGFIERPQAQEPREARERREAREGHDSSTS